ncbi:serine protease [Archangium sp.]|uniref:S1 family peptidase n=1 Tax=Archangium sp. TaxID=1872627 RepID=UPI002D689571|nr:serine protease [Archangium sp.]HYO52583.1 serine protease [Archangium sp.]
MLHRVSVVVLLAVALALSLPTDVRAEPNEKALKALAKVDGWKKSLVLISIRCPGATAPSLGTGVLISDKGYVVTAAHVGSECPAVTTAKMGAVKSPYTAPGEELNASLVHRRVDGKEITAGSASGGAMTEDIALWKVSNMTGSGLVPAKLSADYPVPGEDVRVVGFAGLPFQYYGNPHNSMPGLTVYKTSLSSVAARSGDVPYRLHYTGATLPGVSGGPVFNDKDELVGIHSGRVTKVIEKLVSTNCSVDSFQNCAILKYTGANGATVQQSIGVNFMSVKSVLDNYSWATSVLAIPSSWLTAGEPSPPTTVQGTTAGASPR